ncbi:MAG: hypothetical protein COV35_06375 [Alphaproteobacteria bacterium CG11_big_fil_rev_8_21_14_0_20_39_49]|nr:MAG: hypothetical protein COV35_06375 [Alphaproteobacteria bacterium CG11_big_fil_rev_8_21_14_0_20_39_49]
MMVSDAKWLGKVLPQFSDEELSPVLNIGSSTKKFREQDQPHIHKYVFAPLDERGIKVVHCDLKQAEGVDVSADIFDDEALKQLASYNAKAIICTHMFEHVVDKEDLAKRLLSLIPQNGLFFITVPSSYHQHDDPIDTMYRPTPEELAQLFEGQDIIRKDILVDGNYWDKIKQRPLTLFFRHFTRFFIPFISISKWKRSMRKLYWLFNNYKVSAIVGRKVV